MANPRENTIGTVILDECFQIHRELGPGLLESAYQACLSHALRSKGINVDCETTLPIRYKGLQIDAGYRADMIIENLVLVENKSVQSLLPVHDAQVITYLKLSGLRLGYLINWNVPLLKKGIRRLVCHI